MFDPLSANQRRRLLRWSIAAATIALLLVPLAALPGPAIDADGDRTSALRVPDVPERLVYPALDVRHDPFVSAPEPAEGRDDPDPGIVLPPNDGIAAAPIVRAVVLGETPEALVEIDGHARIVGVGARLRGVPIDRIIPGGIVLDDGERLLVNGSQP